MKKSKRKTASSRELSSKQLRQIASLAALPDNQIDYSDIPQLRTDFWKSAVRNPFYRPVKQQLTVRLDADVLVWLRKQGKGYQTRINTLLRNVMVEDVTGKRL